MLHSTFSAGYSGTEKQAFLRPGSFRPATDRKGCLYAWGHNNDALALLSSTYWNGLGRGPAQYNRTPTFSGDYGGQLWSNDTALARMDSAWTYFKALSGVADDTVHLLGISMGALLVLNWARANLSKVASMCLVNPVIDLVDIHDRNIFGFGTEMDGVYGGSGGFATAAPTHSPALNAAAYEPIADRIRAYYGTTDPVVLQATVTDFCEASGAEAVSLGAVGHSAGALTPRDVAKFFALHP
jgi:pimeloyl-ACP methyl ester carboxylesterase